jgi:asparagine synthase (glutamine-hydrolysing)
MFTVPVGEWFKGRLSGYCSTHIEHLLQSSSYFEAAPMRKLLKDHVSGEANNTRELRAVIAVDHSINATDQAQAAA